MKGGWIIRVLQTQFFVIFFSDILILTVLLKQKSMKIKVFLFLVFGKKCSYDGTMTSLIVFCRR